MPLRAESVRWLSGCALAVRCLCLAACEADPHDPAAPPRVSGTWPEPGDPPPPAPDGGAPPDAGGRYIPPDPDDYTGPRVAPGVDLRAAHEIVRRECVPLRFGTGFTLEPGITCSGNGCGPGIECTRTEDCKREPHARCLSASGGRCDYGDGALGDRLCVADSDCHDLPNGRCVGTIKQTVCQYGNKCETSADCPGGMRCDCNESGDLRCFEVDCLVDTDCTGAQQCLRANPCNFGPFGDYRCTTPADECVPYAEPSCGCDYDTDDKHWRCIDIICD